jgi:hypothetical protein
VLRRDLSRYRSNLTADSSGSMNEWNFVEFPPIEQSFIISRDGTLWRYLNHQEKTHKTAFNNHFIPLNAFTPKAWFKFCLHLEYNASINRMWINSYYCQELVTGGTGYGFVVADPNNDCDADFPLKYLFRIDVWSQQLYNVFAKTVNIPSGQAQTILLSCQGNGYLFLRHMHSLLNPNLLDITSSVCSTIPTQDGSLFFDYVWSVQFHHHMQGFVHDYEVDLGDTHVQDMFISNMDHSDTIIAELYHDRESMLKSKQAKFEANPFFNTMSLLVEKLFDNDSVSSAWSTKPQSRSHSKSSFSQNKTNATNVVRASTEYGMSSDPDFTSVGLHSITFDDINLDSCNDAELGLLL